MDLPHYQTIPDLGIKGRMDTTIEFDAIGFPKDLSGSGNRKLLDIGCNAGAFMLEALKRGAGYVVGVDHNEDWCDRAEATMRYAKYGLKLKGNSVVACADALAYLKKFNNAWVYKFNYVLCLSV